MSQYDPYQQQQPGSGGYQGGYGGGGSQGNYGGGYPGHQPQQPAPPQQPSYGYGGYPGQQAQPYGYDQYGYGYQQPAPPKKKTAVWIWAVVAVIVIAAAGVGGYFVFRGDDKKTDDASGTGGRSITLPASFEGYVQIKTFDTSAVKAQLGSKLAQFGVDASSSVQHAQIGVYGQGSSSTPSVIFISIALSDVPKLADKVAQDGVEATVRDFVGGANDQVTSGGTPQVVSPGTKGGSMLCSAGNLNSAQIGYCGWGDQSVFALTIVVGASSPEAAATTTRTLREAAES